MTSTTFTRALLNRRHMLAGLAAAAALPQMAAAKIEGPVTAIVPFPAGGALDGLARIVTKDISKRTGTSFIVENQGGANGMIGAHNAASARPDGKTWLFGHDALITVNDALFPRQNGFDPRKDLAPARGLAQSPSLLVVNPKLGPKTIAEFVEMGRKKEILFASGGIGVDFRRDLSQKRRGFPRAVDPDATCEAAAISEA